MATKLYEKEVRFARSFIKYLKGNQVNGYLLLAVIAWMRAESGQNYLGNNPFNIRISPYASGYRQTKNGNGKFAIFASLDIAAKATVKFLQDNASFGHYGPIIAAARRGLDSDKGLDAARSFLTAIAMSKWSSDHYGAADGNEQNNRLIKIWAGLTGTPIPAKWFEDTEKVVKKRVIPRQPRALQHVLPATDYVAPYGAREFYNEKPHLGQFILPRDDV